MFSIPSLSLSLSLRLSPPLSPSQSRLRALNAERTFYRRTQKPECGIEEIYDVQGVGIVVGGVVRKGQIKSGQKMRLGPIMINPGDDEKKERFPIVTVQAIHVRQRHTPVAYAGQMASFHIKELTSREDVRRGMVLVDVTEKPKSCFTFEAEIDVLYECKLRKGSQPIVHIGMSPRALYDPSDRWTLCAAQKTPEALTHTHTHKQSP